MSVLREYKPFHTSIILLIIFYTVGVLGLSIETFRPFFLKLTPWNLLLTLLLTGYGYSGPKLPLYRAIVATFLIGFLVEAAGVASGILFGNYWYGQVLGPMVMEVPLLIGVNWFILSVSAWWLSAALSQNRRMRVVIAAALMVLLDIFIEPVAMKLGFWNWQNTEVPLRNYLMWFVTSILAIGVLERLKLSEEKALGTSVWFIQLIFFIVLNFTL